MFTIRTALCGAALACLPTLVTAETAECPMTYEQFEFAIPHLDLEDCPPALAGEDRFCRAATGNDLLHVYAFSFEGGQCLLGMVSLDAEAFALDLR